MAIDEDHDDGLGGRSRTRREVTEGNRWAKVLCALRPAQLAAAPIPDEIREEVALHGRLTSARARNRQARLVDKLVRQLEPERVAELDRFLADPDRASAEIDRWCDRIVAEGDAALDAFLALHPSADRQRLRQLARNARGAPGRRRALREALEQA